MYSRYDQVTDQGHGATPVHVPEEGTAGSVRATAIHSLEQEVQKGTVRSALALHIP